jgi:hypothetical protein
MNRYGASLIVLLGLALVIGMDPATEAAPGDEVKLSFVFMGCNRIQHSDWKKIKKDDPSSANLPQIKQSFKDIAAMKPAPSYFFFVGDLVVNLEDDDGSILKKQLEAWADLFHDSPVKGKLTLVPLPGNHEMLRKLKDDKDADDTEVPNKHCDSVWLKWLKKSGFDTVARVANGPTAGHPKEDHLVDDQSELTYSFNIKDIHFIVINTDTISSVIDPKTKHPYAGWVPYHWIEKDVKAAQEDSKISAIFLFGHKPIMDHPKKEEDSILNEGDYKLGDKLQSLFQSHSKVRAYLCAHEHVWDSAPLAKAPKVYQVIAGNAGSQLNSKWSPPGGTYFGFSEIKIYGHGKVGLINHARPTPTPPQLYFEDHPQAPMAATPRPEEILFAGS